jgi:hypothetical protein
MDTTALFFMRVECGMVVDTQILERCIVEDGEKGRTSETCIDPQTFVMDRYGDFHDSSCCLLIC